MDRTRTLLPLLAAVLCVSCARTPASRALGELDRELARRAEYEERFRDRCDSLCGELFAAVADSLRWEAAHRLYQTYIHFSADSAAHYISLMRSSARTPAHRMLTEMEMIRLLVWAGEENAALEEFHNLNLEAVEAVGVKAEYLSTAIEVFRNLARYPAFIDESRNYADSLDLYRLAYIEMPGQGYESEKIRAKYLVDKGEFEEALKIFRQCLLRYGSDLHDATSIHYNMAEIYGRQGDYQQRVCSLVNSAIADVRACNRDMLSLYSLSMELFRDGDISRASRYIKIHFEAVQAGRYYYAFGEAGAKGVFCFGYEESYDDPYYVQECRTIPEWLPYLEKGCPSRGFFREPKVDPGDREVPLSLCGHDFAVHCIDGEKNAHGIIIQTAQDEYIIAGVGAWIDFGPNVKLSLCEELRGGKVWQVLNGDETGHHNMLYLRGRLYQEDFTAPDGAEIPAPRYGLSHQRRFKAVAHERFKTSGIYRIQLCRL